MTTNSIKYFENGFLVLTSGTTGSAILGLQDISLSYSVDTTELQAFDTNFQKLYAPSYKNWSVSASGVFMSMSGESEFPQSGDTNVVGGQSAAALLELIKLRKTDQKIILKLDTNNYQKGSVLVTSFEVSATAGENMSFSLELQGTSELTKATS